MPQTGVISAFSSGTWIPLRPHSARPFAAQKQWLLFPSANRHPGRRLLTSVKTLLGASCSMDVFQQVGAAKFLMGLLPSERNTPLREALLMLSKHEEAVKLMGDAFANL